MIKSNQAVNLSSAFAMGADMSTKEGEILEDIVSKTKFKPEVVLWRSSYWGTNQIGAVHYRGKFEGQAAVLKIQGVKPEVSEVLMIREFEKQNRSKIIRPPKLYHTVPWVDDKGYEALIMEHVSGSKVLESGKIQTSENIKTFLSLYREYRQNCLPKKPWLPMPAKSNLTNLAKSLIATSEKAYPNDPRRQTGDKELAKKAYHLLAKIYENISLEFIQGHFSVEDLIRQDDQVVLFSNLFWKWRFPFFDAVFGYHWFMFELCNVQDTTSSQIEEQRKIWLFEIFSLPWVQESYIHLKLAKAALLERAVAGFIIDSFLADRSKQIAEYLTESCRDQTRKLIEELT